MQTLGNEKAVNSHVNKGLHDNKNTHLIKQQAKNFRHFSKETHRWDKHKTKRHSPEL